MLQDIAWNFINIAIGTIPLIGYVWGVLKAVDLVGDRVNVMVVGILFTAAYLGLLSLVAAFLFPPEAKAKKTKS